MSEPPAVAGECYPQITPITQIGVGVNRRTAIRVLSTEPNPHAKSVSLLFACHVFFWLCVLLPVIASAQTQQSEVQATGDLQLNVNIEVNGKETGLQRKRFYLIKGSLEENKALIDKINQQPFLTRECFYRAAKASEAFITWLKEADCESVYCQPIEEEYVTGAKAIPEFQKAYERSVKEYKSPELGRLWLTTNLTNVIRDGFYRQKEAAIKALIEGVQIQERFGGNSVMTSRSGTAFFTDVTPGTYLVTNLVPIELGGNLIVWTCEVKVTSGKNALVIPSATNTCVDIKKTVPVCDANKHTTSIR